MSLENYRRYAYASWTPGGKHVLRSLLQHCVFFLWNKLLDRKSWHHNTQLVHAQECENRHTCISFYSSNADKLLFKPCCRHLQMACQIHFKSCCNLFFFIIHLPNRLFRFHKTNANGLLLEGDIYFWERTPPPVRIFDLNGREWWGIAQWAVFNSKAHLYISAYWHRHDDQLNHVYRRM